MKSGKRVLGVIIVSLLLISSISLVSAGIKEWFGFGDKSEDLSGELPESATARVKILDTSPPVVVYVSSVEDGKGVLNTVTPNIRTSGGNINVKIWFLAQQGGGVGNLDSTPGTFHSNATFFRTGSTTRQNLSCVTLGQVGCGSFCTGNAVNYSCTIVMRYYDDPATNWAINATVYDTSNRRGNNETKQFSVASVSAASSAVNYLNWTNPPLTTSDTNRYADNNYMVDNDGNTGIPTTRVNATSLVGLTNPAFSILPTKFTANPANPGTCGGTDLGQDTNPVITGFSVPKAVSDAGSQSELHFCLRDVAGLQSQDYNGTRPWIVTFA